MIKKILCCILSISKNQTLTLIFISTMLNLFIGYKHSFVFINAPLPTRLIDQYEKIINNFSVLYNILLDIA